MLAFLQMKTYTTGMTSFEQLAGLGLLPTEVDPVRFWRSVGEQANTMADRLIEERVTEPSAKSKKSSPRRIDTDYPLPQAIINHPKGRLISPEAVLHVVGNYSESAAVCSPDVSFSVLTLPRRQSTGTEFTYTDYWGANGRHDPSRSYGLSENGDPLNLYPPKLILVRGVLQMAGLESELWTIGEFPSLQTLAVAAARVELAEAEPS